MRYWYKILLFFYKSVLRKNPKGALLNNINGCSFDDINEMLNGMKITVFDKTDDGFMVLYTEMYTEYILSYDKQGILKKIESEYWKDMDVKFEKK